MYNRQRYLQKLGIQNPIIIQQQNEEQQRMQEQQKNQENEIKQKIETSQKITQQTTENANSVKTNVQTEKQMIGDSSSTQSESFSSTRKLETELVAPCLQKNLPYDDEIAKYLVNPVVLDEKEDSTADDDDDDRINDLQTDQQHAPSMRKTRLQLSQSFVNKDGDFLINYYIKEDNSKIRNKYINKLISNKILRQEQSKKHQTMIIFDWDDTLFCTSQLHAQRFENITAEQQKNLLNLDKSASLCLKEAANYGETYIITNAAQGWVEYSSKNFMPTVYKYLEQLKIKVISARSLYENQYPNQCHQWKVEAFKDIKTNFDKQIITNLICLGDSHIEIEAAHILAKEFDQSFIKTVKFKEQPRIEELIKQQDLVRDKLEQIYTNFKNLTIRLEKKSNPKDTMKK